MSKKLVTVKNIKDYLDAGGTTLCHTDDMIITPLAQDYCRKNRIQITVPGASVKRQEREEAKIQEVKNTNQEEKKINENLPLDHLVKQLIRKEFGVVREDQVQSIARVVLAILEKEA